jgi:ABC-type multidrug transport system permease subunit
MTVTITLIAATLMGAFLLAFAIPRTGLWLANRVENSKKMDEWQKRRLANVFVEVGSTPLINRKGNKTEIFLSIFLLVLLGVQHYFLYVGNTSEARMVVIGMFFMLAVFVYQNLAG